MLVFYFIALCTSMISPSVPPCTNIQKFDDKERKYLLLSRKIPSCALKVNPKRHINIYKYFHVCEDAQKKAFETLIYNKASSIVVEQFFFHYELSKKVLSEDFFPYQTQCFVDEKFYYLVFSPVQTLSNFYTYLEIDSFSVKKTKEIYIEILERFKQLEGLNAVLNDISLTIFSFSPLGLARLKPVEFAHFWRAGSKVYSSIDDESIENNVSLQQKMQKNIEMKDKYITIGPEGTKYITEISSKDWNIYFCLRLILDLSNRHKKVNFKQAERSLFDSFNKQILEWYQNWSFPNKILNSWDKLISTILILERYEAFEIDVLEELDSSKDYDIQRKDRSLQLSMESSEPKAKSFFSCFKQKNRKK